VLNFQIFFIKLLLLLQRYNTLEKALMFIYVMILLLSCFTFR